MILKWTTYLTYKVVYFVVALLVLTGADVIVSLRGRTPGGPEAQSQLVVPAGETLVATCCWHDSLVGGGSQQAVWSAANNATLSNISTLADNQESNLTLTSAQVGTYYCRHVPSSQTNATAKSVNPNSAGSFVLLVHVSFANHEECQPLELQLNSTSTPDKENLEISLTIVGCPDASSNKTTANECTNGTVKLCNDSSHASHSAGNSELPQPTKPVSTSVKLSPFTVKTDPITTSTTTERATSSSSAVKLTTASTVSTTLTTPSMTTPTAVVRSSTADVTTTSTTKPTSTSSQPKSTEFVKPRDESAVKSTTPTADAVLSEGSAGLAIGIILAIMAAGSCTAAILYRRKRRGKKSSYITFGNPSYSREHLPANDFGLESPLTLSSNGYTVLA